MYYFLQVFVLVLVALHAAHARITRQRNNQTSKRELLEGNFGDRKALLSKYAAVSVPGIQYAENINDELADQSPAQQIFGARLPQIAKISDVLTGQGPPFEVAVANHLYAPVSVYQARLSSPTTFEIPSPAASQLAYPHPKSYKPRKHAQEQKPAVLPPREAEQLRYQVNVPVYAVKQPRFRFETYPRPFSHVMHRLQQINSQNPYQQQPAPQPYPAYDDIGPNRFAGPAIPSQYAQPQGLIQLVPYDSGYDYVDMADKALASDESREELKPEATERPKLQAELPQPKKGYRAHPNGAISFASFTQGLPPKPHLKVSKPQPVEASVQQTDQSSPIQSYQHQEQQEAKESLHYPPIFEQYIRQLQKYQPYQQEVTIQAAPQSSPQLMTYNVPIRQQPRNLNPLRQQLLIESPHQVLQTLEFQRIPAFKPLPQTQLRPESHYPSTTASPTTQKSVPQFESVPQVKQFIYHGQPTQNQAQFTQPIVPVVPHRHLTPLPPLKPNYSQSVKPLVYQTPPAFLPTPVQPLATATPKLSFNDQIISSTTTRPTVNDEAVYEDEEQKEEIAPQQNGTPKSLEPEITYQSQPTALPLEPVSVTVQPTTYRPSTSNEPRSDNEQHTTPQPQYHSTENPQPTLTPPRHEVIIQRQELQELILEPTPQPVSAHIYSHPRQQPNSGNQHEHEVYQIQSQPLRNDLEQLQPQLYQQIIQELRSQENQRGARQREESLESLRQQLESQLYQNQQRSQPVPQQYQAQQLQIQLQKEQTQSQQEQGDVEAKEYEQNTQLEPQNALHQPFSASQSSDKPQKKPEPQGDDQQKTVPHTAESEEQKEPPHTPAEPKPVAANGDESFLGSNYPLFQQIYRQPHELVVHPEYGSPVGISGLPDVQFFGKYAESLFSGLQH
ncbi:mediator of RNA polymerase II transcription subunit 15-like isoform X1 [Trichoplusia ni]|uniref:Mediator of RNA polymerase II transcription subunit 15-like isoform X1 n=1 Tax=Trichoplusia ni TaxID=7111 RepID=A0A7E5WNJ4_TRINI|nr:mediator of RNA polymerase II transcription subunit 15-like isoform X1 [Trichoplusia ni]